METAQLGLVLFDDDSESSLAWPKPRDDTARQLSDITRRIEQTERIEIELKDTLRAIRDHKHSGAKQHELKQPTPSTAEQILLVLEKRLQILTAEASSVLQELQNRANSFIAVLSRQFHERKSKELYSLNSQRSVVREEQLSRLSDQLAATKRSNQSIVQSLSSRVEALEALLNRKVEQMTARERSLKALLDARQHQIDELAAALKQERGRSEQPALTANTRAAAVEPHQRRSQQTPGKTRGQTNIAIIQPLDAHLRSLSNQELHSGHCQGSYKSVTLNENKENYCSRTRRKKIFGDASNICLKQAASAIRPPNSIEEVLSPIRKTVEDSHLTQTQHLWALEKLEDFHQEHGQDGSEEDVFFYPERGPNQQDSELVVNERSSMNALEAYQLLSRQEQRGPPLQPQGPNFYSPFEIGNRT